MVEAGRNRQTRFVPTFEQREHIRKIIIDGKTDAEITSLYPLSRRALFYEKRQTSMGAELPHELRTSNRKRLQKPKYDELEEHLMEVFSGMRNAGLPMSGPYLQAIARTWLKRELEREGVTEEFRAKYKNASFGQSWLEGFKWRNDLRALRINGERASLPFNIDELMCPIRTLIDEKGLGPANIYNWDETGLFYRSLPQYTLAGRGDSGAGAKADKSRFTLMVCTNGDGSDTTVILIGKSKTPRGTSKQFWDSHGVRYFANSKAWMTGEIFNTLLEEFEQRLTSPTILLIDNFAGHHVSEDFISRPFTHLIPVFLPPNTTASTQPLDAGIIAMLKIKFRTLLLEYVCDEFAKGTLNMGNVNISRITPWINIARKQLLPKSIQSCFYKSLKMEIFNVNPADTPNITSELVSLQSSIVRYLGDNVEIGTAFEYATRDVVSDNDDVPEDDVVEEVVRVVDPNLLIRKLPLFYEYFENTGMQEGIAALNIVRDILNRHMNVE